MVLFRTMLDYLRYPLLISLWVVTLMSGILSILREALSIYRPQTEPRSLFWNCVVIAFVLSAGILWVIEHQKVAEQEALRISAESKLIALSHPDFAISVGATISAYVEEKHSTISITYMKIVNNGAESSAVDWVAHYTSAKLNSDVPIIQILSEPFELPIPNRPAFKMYRNQNILVRASTPVPRGGLTDGFLVLQLPGDRTQEFKEGGASMVTDYIGTKYVAQYHSNGKTPLGIPTMISR
jgi:hypothetical protein